MSTHNIQCHDKIRKNPKYIFFFFYFFFFFFFFLSYWKNFVGTEKRVRIITGKRAIRVRAIEVILYFLNQIWYQVMCIKNILEHDITVTLRSEEDLKGLFAT